MKRSLVRAAFPFCGSDPYRATHGSGLETKSRRDRQGAQIAMDGDLAAEAGRREATRDGRTFTSSAPRSTEKLSGKPGAVQVEPLRRSRKEIETYLLYESRNDWFWSVTDSRKGHCIRYANQYGWDTSRGSWESMSTAAGVFGATFENAENRELIKDCPTDASIEVGPWIMVRVVLHAVAAFA